MLIVVAAVVMALAFEDARLALIAGGVGVAIALLVGELLTRAIGGPLREMTEASEALRGGDLSMRVRSRGTDELGALGNAIDGMADQLVERFDEARREEGRLRTILDSMSEAVFVTDAEGAIVLTNAALTRLAGGRVEGRTAIEAIRSPELHAAVRRAITKGVGAEVELELVTQRAGRSIRAQVAPLPKRQGVVAVLHDVTELKRADAVRRDFVANASHELRTPLTSIRGFAETLLDGALADERTAQRFVGHIGENARRLERLVEDLLELSRAESPESKLELVRVDASALAAEVVGGAEQRALEKRVALALEVEPAAASADRRALDQILLNLVDNAIKYTGEGGHVTVRVKEERVKGRDQRVVIEVEDDGPGIPAAHLDRIFERFYRVDKGRSRDQGGTGLGLSIVKHLVQRMGGEVSVESRVGHGSVFRVSLASAAK
jgi:two-component system phosphate regulon sensor histidine kinase PhoR